MLLENPFFKFIYLFYITAAVSTPSIAPSPFPQSPCLYSTFPFFLSFFSFACTYVCVLHAWSTWGGTPDSHETRVIAVSYHVGPGNWTWILWTSRQCSNHWAISLTYLYTSDGTQIPSNILPYCSGSRLEDMAIYCLSSSQCLWLPRGGPNASSLWKTSEPLEPYNSTPWSCTKPMLTLKKCAFLKPPFVKFPEVSLSNAIHGLLLHTWLGIMCLHLEPQLKPCPVPTTHSSSLPQDPLSSSDIQVIP